MDIRVAGVIIVVIIIIAGVAIYAAEQGKTPQTTTQTTTTSQATSPTKTTTTKTTATSPTHTTSSTTTTSTITGTQTTTTTMTMTTTTTTEEYVLTIGTSKIHVSPDLYNFAMQAKNGEIKVTINMWTAMLPFENKAMEQVIDQFQKEYPGITIKYTGQVQNLKEAVKASIIAGDTENGPDIFTWAHDWTGELAEGGYIVALDKYLPPETLYDLQSQYLSVAYSAATYQLHLYGLPWAAEAMALICNSNMVKGPITSFDQMKSIMEQYYNPDQGTYGLSYQIDPYHVYPFITAFNGFYYDEDKDIVGLNSTGTEEGLKFFLSNILPYLDTSDLGHENQLKNFLEGKTPCIITGPWDVAAIKDAGINFFVQQIQAISETNVPKPFSGIKTLWITTLAEQDKNKLYASILFSLWFSLDDNVSKTLAEQAGFIPVKGSVAKYVITNQEKYPVISGFLSSISNSVPMPKSPKMAKVWGPITNAINALITVYQEQGLDASLQQVDPTLDQAQAEVLQAFQR
jgi:arabinogalactan oligomer/maltooligosaccharide transport system substrate-binding protein